MKKKTYKIELKKTQLSKPNLTIDSFCFGCNKPTKHSIEESITQYGHEMINAEISFDWRNIYQIISCKGCEYISFRNLYFDDQRDIIKTGPGRDDCDLDYDITQYPNILTHHFALNNYYSLPTKIRDIYIESSKALNNELPILAGIGVRAIIETVAKDNNCTDRVLFDKIRSLVTTGVLTSKDGTILQKLRGLGNDSAHNVKAHSIKTLTLAMEVIDHLLKGVYLLPESTDSTL